MQAWTNGRQWKTGLTDMPGQGFYAGLPDEIAH
jgi:hypothetical protein